MVYIHVYIYIIYYHILYIYTSHCKIIINRDLDETSPFIPNKDTAAWLTVPEPVSTRSGQHQMGGPNLTRMMEITHGDDSETNRCEYMSRFACFF